ncbi:uncharacterized protein [Bemisia tabaci]|uniref:uncharacterized protein isoform X2 n=1 Tax=Bemisia tabaci TaxID=7038 RepID=UPI003B27DC79
MILTRDWTLTYHVLIALLSLVAFVLCQYDDEMSDKDVQALMEAQRQRDREFVSAQPPTTTAKPGYIHRSRGELTVDLLRHHLIADFVFDVPFIVCTVQWVEGHFAELGNLIPVDVAEFPPYLIDYRGNKSEWYTFIMAGLDEPSREEPSLREYLHWLIVNIPGNRTHDGTELYKYKGVHRHGIVVYKQPRKLIFDKESIKSPYFDDPRANFSNYQFAEKYQLGEPVAVNFFQTEWMPKPTLLSSLESLFSTKRSPTKSTKKTPLLYT